jgi:hypothetical protein
MSFDHTKQINPQVAALNYNQQLIVANHNVHLKQIFNELGTSCGKQSSVGRRTSAGLVR